MPTERQADQAVVERLRAENLTRANGWAPPEFVGTFKGVPVWADSPGRPEWYVLPEGRGPAGG